MLNLESTEKISLITSSTANINIIISYVDIVTSTEAVTADKQLTAITSAATTDICAAPAAGTVRNVKGILIKNKHASTSNTVTPQINVSGTLYELTSDCILLFGESLILNAEGTWFHYDANGGVYGQSLPAAGDAQVGGIEIAVQSEMESGSDTTLAVTPGRFHYHPSTAKFWVKTTPGNVNAASYNVTSVADTAAGITVVTIATDFSSASWCCQAQVESTSDTLTVTNCKLCRIGLGDQAAGTVSIECHDLTATTVVMEDPTAWHVVGYGDQ